MHVSLRPIAVRNASGVQFRHPVSPSSWRGQTDCIVGPFSSKDVAAYFTRHAMALMLADSAQAVSIRHEAYDFRVFVKGCEWYIEIQHATALALA